MTQREITCSGRLYVLERKVEGDFRTFHLRGESRLDYISGICGEGWAVFGQLGEDYIEIRDEIGHYEYVTYIDSFHVEGRERRGLGIGGRMLDCLLNHDDSDVVFLVASPTDTAGAMTRKEKVERLVRFYEKHGFEKLPSNDLMWLGIPMARWKR